MRIENKIKICNGLSIISKIFSISIVILFLIIFIGQFSSIDFLRLKKIELLLFLFVPIGYSVGAILAWYKEKTGSLLMIFFILFFNFSTFLFEFKFDEFEFIIFITPAFVLFSSSLYKNFLENHKESI